MFDRQCPIPPATAALTISDILVHSPALRISTVIQVLQHHVKFILEMLSSPETWSKETQLKVY